MRLEMEPDFEVVGEASDGHRAVVAVRDADPDVVLMDVELPVMDGIQATAALRDAAPRCAVVMLSMHDDTVTRTRAREAGAVAFVAKHEMDSALTRAIRSAAPRPSGGIDQSSERPLTPSGEGATS